jgi:tRNA modification GTPase
MILDDTIAAIASPPGGAARGIVRMSGPAVGRCLTSVFTADDRRKADGIVHPTALRGAIRLAALHAPLACQVYLWPDRRSYTGQPVAEIHMPGSPPLLEAALDAVCQAGARLAEPGEFTLRAFLAGRIDLTQAEAVLGVIDATDRSQLDVALAQLAGGLARPLTELRSELLSLLADLEAGLDFPDEDLPLIDAATLTDRLQTAVGLVNRLGAQMDSRAEREQAPRVILLGAPNVGKSSLFNALSGRKAALVWHEPGTTRDYLLADLDLDGLRCRLVDTAGVESTSTPQSGIDAAAQVTASQQARAAQLRVFCVDAARGRNAWEEKQLATHDPRRILVFTKIDRARDVVVPDGAMPTSSTTGQGIDALRRRLRESLCFGPAGELGVVAGTAVRCRQSLHLAGECLTQAHSLIAARHGEELVAAELRTALVELGRVAGEVYTEEILGVVFSRFCVGK